MRISGWNPAPIHAIPFRQASSGGRVGTGILEITTAVIDPLPEELEGLIVTADLQGLSFDGDLLGTLAAQEIHFLCESRLLADANKMGVMLCGDFYASPDFQRGVGGPINEVWHAFEERFRWVAGVAGNHDTFTQNPSGLLHGTVFERDRLRIGGIGGVIGAAKRENQIPAREFEQSLKQILQERPQLLLMHSSPQVAETGCIGDPLVRRILEEQKAPLTFCGHCHWATPLHQLNAHTQICNVDGRVLILLKSDFR
jgi:Icc protein